MAKTTAGAALKLAQLYSQVRVKRLEEQKKVDEIHEQETALKKLLMQSLEELGINSVGDTVKVYSLERSNEPSVEDYTKLYAHIQTTGEFDLLYKRVNNAAVKARWDAGVQVPGVITFPVITLSVTKA